MPHCIIEHSTSLCGDKIVPLVYAGALNSLLFEADGSDIKVRAVSYDSYQTGDQKADFIHVVVKILSGRSAEKKRRLSEQVLEQLEKLEVAECSVTVEIVDIERESYLKVVR